MINVFANNINTAIISLAAECIPNRYIKIKPLEPPWITSLLKRHIRKRKRAYKKAKKSNSELHWKIFKKLRNRVVTMIRESKNSILRKTCRKT